VTRSGGEAGPSAPRFEPDGHGGVTVVVDGQPQSHVDLADPGLVTFEYVQHFCLALGACMPPAPSPLRVTHVGGAGMTLARWVQHTRPGSAQIVLEPDAALTAAVRERLPLPRGHRIRVRPLDGRTGVAGLGTASADVVVLDAYAAGRVPAELVAPAFVAQVARVLAPGGVLLANLADEPGLRWATRALATVAAVDGFADLAVVATHDVLKGRRFGNLVLVAALAPCEGGSGRLDLADLRRLAASAPIPTGVRSGTELTRLIAGARPFTLADAQASPVPPAPGAWRVR
jgi:spermidine synthase